MTTTNKVMLLIIVLLTVSTVVLWTRHQKMEANSGKVDARAIEQIVKEKQYADSLMRENAKKDSALKSQAIKSEKLKHDNALIKEGIVGLAMYADSLEQVTRSRHSDVCDSALTAKNSVIDQQKSLIAGMEEESGLYVEQIKLLKGINANDSALIQRQTLTIAEISCAYNWKIRHKFLAWLLGFKCNR